MQTISIRLETLQNALFNVVAGLIGATLVFISLPIIIHHLGTNLAGVWFLAYVFLNYLDLLSFGFRPALIKHTAEYYPANPAKISQLFSTAFFTMVGWGICIGIVINLGAPLLALILKGDSVIGATGQQAILILGLMLPLLFPAGLARNLLEGFRNYRAASLTRILIKTIEFIGIILVLRYGGGLIQLLMVVTNLMAIEGVANLLLAKRTLPQLTISLAAISQPIFLVLLRFGWIMLLIQIAGTLALNTDKLILSHWLGTSSVSFYEPMDRIASFALMMVQFTVAVFLPAAAYLLSSYAASTEKLRELFILGTKYSLAIFLALAVPIAMIAPNLLAAWVGPSFAQYGTALRVLLLASLFLITHQAGYHMFIGAGKLKIVLGFTVAIAAINLLATLILVPRIGFIGSVIGSAIAFGVVEPFYVARLLREYQIRWRTFFSAIIIPTCQPILLTVPLVIGLLYWLKPVSTPWLALIIAIAGVFYVVIILLTGSPQEKTYFAELFRSLRRIRPI